MFTWCVLRKCHVSEDHMTDGSLFSKLLLFSAIQAYERREVMLANCVDLVELISCNRSFARDCIRSRKVANRGRLLKFV